MQGVSRPFCARRSESQWDPPPGFMPLVHEHDGDVSEKVKEEVEATM